MGLIKFKGQVIYQGPLVELSINDGWNNSMGEYYPSASALFVVNGESLQHKVLDIPGFVDPMSQRKDFEVLPDPGQIRDIDLIHKRRKAKEEAERFDIHKSVRVISGRKVPIGTEGEIFWMGDNGWGMSVGIRLLDGKKVFTAIKNVQLIKADEEFERLLLGEDGK